MTPVVESGDIIPGVVRPMYIGPACYVKNDAYFFQSESSDTNFCVQVPLNLESDPPIGVARPIFWCQATPKWHDTTSLVK